MHGTRQLAKQTATAFLLSLDTIQPSGDSTSEMQTATAFLLWLETIRWRFNSGRQQ